MTIRFTDRFRIRISFEENKIRKRVKAGTGSHISTAQCAGGPQERERVMSLPTPQIFQRGKRVLFDRSSKMNAVNKEGDHRSVAPHFGTCGKASDCTWMNGSDER